jgi:hypothetical protein
MRITHLALSGLLAVAFAAGCKSSGTAAAKEDLQLVPKETDVILMANLSRARNTVLWRRMLDLRDQDATTKKEYDDFVQRCALDPLRQIDSVFLAVPQGVNDSKEFAAIVRGTFNEDKLVQCARDQAKKDGRDVAVSEYGGKKLYTDTQTGQAFATFLDGRTVAMGGKEWIKKVIDLAAGKKEAGPSAKENADLVSLMKRARTSDALWGAGLVPQSARDAFKNDPHLSAAGSMKNVFGSIDLAAGFAADINVDLGSEADAKDLQARATAKLGDVKKHPQVMVMGLSPMLDTVKVDARGATFHFAISLNQQQVDDIINRVKGLLKGFGSQLGGSGMGSLGVP